MLEKQTSEFKMRTLILVTQLRLILANKKLVRATRPFRVRQTVWSQNNMNNKKKAKNSK